MFRGQVVDTPTAAEFTRLTLQRIGEEELATVAGLLAAKSRAFTALLAPDRLPSLTEEEVRAVLRSVFAARRRVDVILNTLTLEGFLGHVGRLLHGPGDPGARLEAFHEALSTVGRGAPDTLGHDLGSELLHFTDPERHWLWTRWMWDPATGKGALPLVVMDEVDLAAETVAESYRRVGVAVAFVTDVGEAAGFTKGGSGVFDTDVFLASVYGVYMYTTLRLRMTQEFSKIMPELDELLRRLLGVHKSPLLTEVVS